MLSFGTRCSTPLSRGLSSKYRVSMYSGQRGRCLTDGVKLSYIVAKILITL